MMNVTHFMEALSSYVGFLEQRWMKGDLVCN